MSFESEQFKKFMLRLGLTQRDFAKAVGKSQSNVSKYCNGKMTIPFEVVKLLHEKYKMSYDWYFDNNGAAIRDQANKNTLISDIADLKDTIQVLEGKLRLMTSNFNQLHAEYQKSRQQKSNQNPV